VLHTLGEQKGREERGGTDDDRVPLNGAAGGSGWWRVPRSGKRIGRGLRLDR
jgi:hypothetical protein